MENLKGAYHEGKKWLKNYGPLLILVSVAAILRYTGLGSLPGGLFPDEAANGLDINSILNGKLQPFYERGNGREALFFYLLTPAVAILGRTPLAHHLVSATMGVLVVLLTYLLIRRWFNARLAFVAAFLTAVSGWYITLSRTAFRANTAPLFTLLFFYFATRVAQAKSRLEYWTCAVFSGLAFGLGFYTYISYRMMIPLVGLALVMLIIIDLRNQPKWQLARRYWPAVLAGTISFAAALVPLALYFIRKPEWLAGRTGQVSIFSPELNQGDLIGTFLVVFKKTALGFITGGDLNWRHNVSGYPFLSYLIAPLFVVGLLAVTVQAVIFFVQAFRKHREKIAYAINLKRLTFFVMALWFYLMLVPELLTAEGIPHGLRLIGVIPITFVIAALFIEEILTTFPHEQGLGWTIRKKLAALLLIVLLGAEAVYGINLYFGVAGNSPAYAYAFRSDLTAVSQYLNERAHKEKTYLVIDWFSEQTPQYLTTQTKQPYQVVDPASLWQGPDQVRIGRYEHERFGLQLLPGDQVVFTQSSLYDSQAFQRYYPDAKLIKREYNRFGEVIMEIYEQPS